MLSDSLPGLALFAVHMDCNLVHS